MMRKLGSMASCAVAVALAAGTCVAQDTALKPSVGQRFESAVQDLKKGAREAGDSIQQEFAHAKTAVHNMSVSSRVYGRLHWDKELQGAKLNVDVKEDGNAFLTGTVPTAAAKVKAVALARDTVGVVRVNDQLTVGPASEGTPAGTTTTTTTTTTPTSKKEVKVESTTRP
jgi:osmotically-inducible protein OsmY